MTAPFTPVVLESPYSGNVAQNIRYARLCIRDCILNYAEAPYLSHLLYTQALDDTVAEERWAGIQAGFSWSTVTWEGTYPKRVFYLDLGWSRGMELGLESAQKLGQPVEERKLPSKLFELLDVENFEPPEWRV